MTTDQIRQFILDSYVEPARRTGQGTVRVVAGEVHARLRLKNRIPMVCNALRLPIAESGVRIVEQEGPPSGQSSTVAVVYAVEGASGTAGPNPLLALRGAAREVFQALGGGEEFLRAERENLAAGRADLK